MKIPNWKIERDLWNDGCRYVAGIDEVGYGAWAGPVVVGAVVWKVGSAVRGMRDSKVLSVCDRQNLDKKIKNKSLAYSVGEGSVDEINELGLAQARCLAACRAIDGLNVDVEYVLIDGIKVDGLSVSNRVIKKGDSVSVSIASASILAKVYRDNILSSLHRLYSRYGWNRNKGYGTKYHWQAIDRWGLTAHHRVNYKCFDNIDDK